MKPRNILSLSALAAIIVLTLGYIASLGVRLSPPDDRSTVSMTVEDANGLVVGSNVLLRGIPVGEVTDLRPSIHGADITFYVSSDHPIPVDTEFRIDNLSALGETYIGVMPRSAGGPTLRDGQHVTTDRIVQPPSVAELAESVVRLLNQVDPEELARITSELDTALPEEGSVLPHLAHASALLAMSLARIPGRGTELLADMQSLLRNASFVGPDISAAAPDLERLGVGLQTLTATVFRAIRQTGSPASLIDFGKYLGRVQRFLDNSSPDIATLAETLLPGVTTLSAAAKQIDTGLLLETALASTSPDGEVTLRVHIPGP